MEWNHILDKQPENGRSIIQIDAPFEGHYPMRMRKYIQNYSWETYMNWCESSHVLPNFWWMYAEDFPFPNQPERSKREDSALEKFIDEISFGWVEDTLKQRCGALNTQETE